MTIHNIHTIARYEVKLLKRSWLFRIFSILTLLGLSLLMLGYMSTVVNTTDYKWSRLALTSMMPFCNIYFYNLAQSVIVIFLAGSFLKRDKKLDTAEVIYVRPMSNADYIIGKTWGIVKVFLSLNIISLLITAFLNLLINRTPFDLFPYIFYLLTISLPSLLFVLGLSFTVMCLLKNQAVTFIVMLGVIGTVFFYLSSTLYGVFDFFGISIPGIFSDVMGHADLRLFLLQRMIYLLAGIGLISFTIALVKRLPHKPWKIIIVHTIGAIFVVAAGVAGVIYVYHYHRQLKLRNEYIATFNKYAGENNVNILVHDLTVTPKGKQLTGESVLKARNNHAEALDKIILYLNPALTVSSVEAGGNPLAFTREHQAIVIDKPLNSGEEFTFTVKYAGGISETICYTDVPEKDYLEGNVIPETFFQLGKRYAWLEDRFTLLTPECLWYPSAVAPVNPGAPYSLKKNFTDYTLTVNVPAERTVLSQGEGKREGERISFTNQHPLPGISLTIGDYEKKSLQVDSTLYEILYFKGHDYFSQHFTLLKDTLPGVIRELKNDIEIGRGRDYPFAKFVLAETPVQFAGYVRNWKGYTEYVMPEIVFIPERGATLNADFRAEKERLEHWRRGDQGAPDETEITINMFRRFIQSTFTDENVQYGWNWQNKFVNKYNINPMFFAHTSFVHSDEYPVIDIVLNTMQNNSTTTGFRPWGGIINDQQRANLYLESHSFQTAISDIEIKPEIFYELLKLKSTALKNYINAQMPPEELTDFLKEFFRQNSFSDISFETFRQEFEERFDINLDEFIHKWYTEDHSPTVYIRDADANQVVVDELTQYQIKFKVNNPSDVDAIITAQVQQGGGFGGGGRRGFAVVTTAQTPETYIIPAGEAREIKIIVEERPASVTVNTNISHNLPSSYTFNFSKIDNTVTDTIAGTFPIGTEAFKPNPNEIIIDNEDSGFRTIASNTRHKLKDLFQKKEEEKYKNFMPWWMPSKWTAMAADYCYGETINSAVYKRKGSGNNSVVWSAEMPRDGYYEVSVWNPKMGGAMGMRFGPRRRWDREERNQTYTIEYGEEKESITLDMEQEDSGWIPLGNYYLPKGPVTITLTDKVSGGYVIADAVKFTLAD